MEEKTLLRREKKMQDLRDKFESTAIASLPSKPSRLGSLPREIHLQILKHLTSAGRLSLGLSCKDFWAVVHNENTGDLKVLMTDDDRREFLGLLSNNLPRYLVCYECKVMHRRHIDEFWFIKVGGLYKLCNNTRAVFPAPCLDYALSYEMLDLALRFEELSSEFGVPLALLSHQCSFHNIHSGDLPCTVEVLPRMCGRHLLLRIDSYVGIDSNGCLGEQAERVPCLPCIHMSTPAFRLHCVLALRFGTMKLTSGQKWHAMERCAFCATDASTKLIFSENGLVEGLLVRAWKDFGGRGGYGKQPWTGHVATCAQEKAIYTSGEKHLGHVFDGDEDIAEEYGTQISLDPVQRLQVGLI